MLAHCVYYLSYVTNLRWHLHYSTSKSGFYMHHKVYLSDSFPWLNFCVCSLFVFLGSSDQTPTGLLTGLALSWAAGVARTDAQSCRWIRSASSQVPPVSFVTSVPGIWSRMRGRQRFTGSTQKSQVSYPSMMNSLEQVDVMMAGVRFHLRGGNSVSCNQVVPAELQPGTLGTSVDVTCARTNHVHESSEPFRSLPTV